MRIWLYLSTGFTLLAQQPVFEKDVRPILERNCLGCHNSKLKMGGLSLASRAELLAGGKRGPVVNLERPPESRLLRAVRHDGALRMPPSSKISEADAATLSRWISSGAVWPESAISSAPPKPNHWAFHAPRRPAEPKVRTRNWLRTPVDSFVLARLEKESIAPSPEADAATLVRRLYLDLTGLLPSPDEVDAFASGKDPRAWAKLVDKLLASPHYGERWARHWLDEARYADSDGGSRDEPRQIWRYRDWVIRAYNEDKPFDQFVIEQLAGDLLPNPTPDQLIATGFHRNSPIQIEAGTDREQYRTEAVFDRTDTTGTVFFGMSVGCARCHDHKFDPISNREYYQLYAFFNTSDDWDESRPRYNAKFHNLHQVHGPLLEYAKPDEIRRRDELVARGLALDEELGELNKTRRDPERAKAITAEINQIIGQLPRFEGSMIMRELPVKRQTHILQTGDYLRKGEHVEAGVPAFLHPPPTGGTMTRLDLARWIADPASPLLARVTVNRIWQQYFGRGLVDTENDFGTQGTPPTHPELLDWLATEFAQSGWSVKAIHRAICNSATYRQSSRVRPDLDEMDPRNMLLARQSRLRLDSEIVRDAALNASGLLLPKVGGPSVFPPQPESAMSASQVKKSWKASTGPDRYRRGMYTFYWRLTPHPALVVFDSPNSMTTCTRRTRSNTPLQALAMLNEAAFHEFAQAFGRRILDSASTNEARIRNAFRLTIAREPRPAEAQRIAGLLAIERDALASKPDEAARLLPAKSDGSDKVELAAWISLARVFLNTDEFITRE